MKTSMSARLRRIWLNVHLWIGVGLAVLLVPIGLSGSFLVWHDAIDPWLYPARYAVTAQDRTLPASDYVASGSKALGASFAPVALRFPEGKSSPIALQARETGGGRGSRPRVLTAYLDPGAGRVLEVAEFRTTLVGFLHRFHENLTIPEYSGRAIVGWVGVAMLISSLTGIWLWWPRTLPVWRGLRWQRGPTLPLNLHHAIGFWIAIPLAVISATGIYLAFPPQARDLLSAFAPMSPQQRTFGVPLLAKTALDIDAALTLARGAEPDRKPSAIFFPNRDNQAWRVQFNDDGNVATVLVDDRTSTVTRAAAPLSGDRIALSLRRIHDGSHMALAWQAVVFLCGLAPTVFVVTGWMIWLRKRRRRRAAVGAVADAQPAE